jgi:hypothetical protein
MQETCSRCGSAKIIPRVPLLDRYGEMGGFTDPAEVRVHGDPQAWVFKETATGQVSLRICGECGHAELQVSNFRELYERYEKSGQHERDKESGPPADSVAADSAPEGACLSCGKPIPEEASRCPACGWSWAAEQVTPAEQARD